MSRWDSCARRSSSERAVSRRSKATPRRSARRKPPKSWPDFSSSRRARRLLLLLSLRPSGRLRSHDPQALRRDSWLGRLAARPATRRAHNRSLRLLRCRQRPTLRRSLGGSRRCIRAGCSPMTSSPPPRRKCSGRDPEFRHSFRPTLLAQARRDDLASDPAAGLVPNWSPLASLPRPRLAKPVSYGTEGQRFESSRARLGVQTAPPYRRSMPSQRTRSARGRLGRDPVPKELRLQPQTVRSASVGDSRAARSAGTSPATAPISSAAPNPPAHARVGTTTVQPFAAA
jgi:hypothetical protein